MVKYFTGRDEFQIEDSRLYIENLQNREKLSIVNGDRFILKDFCGYIGDDLYIPEKLHLLLQLDEDSYKQLFTNLFGQILNYFDDEILFQLFPTKFGLGEYTLNQSLIFQLNTILKNRDSIEYALYLIGKQPYRALKESSFYGDFSTISAIDDKVIEDIIHNPQNWHDNDPLKPIEVLQYKNIETLNTIENSFIKHFLQELLIILDKLVKFTEDTPVQRMQIRGLQDHIDEIFSTIPFDEIDEMTLFPYNSQVLLKRDGYRELFDIYNRLYLSFKPSLFNSLENAISLKDISTIWEYYVLIKLIDHFGVIDTTEIENNLRIEKEKYEKITIIFKSGVKVSYQAVFSSYSGIKFRPDFYIEMGELLGNRKFVVDAKFRVFNQKSRTDILKNMHYYRDGLGLNSAVAITIGDREKGELFSQDGEITPINGLRELFSQDGIGYISLNLKNLLIN